MSLGGAPHARGRVTAWHHRLGPGRLLLLLGALLLVLILLPVWLPGLGIWLTREDPVAPADVALVMEGTGADAMLAAETWRQAGVVHDVIIVEAPVKTHALVAYWTDFVRWGLAPPAPTPPEHLRVVRAPATLSAEQARASLPILRELDAHSVLVPGGGGIGTRLVGRDLQSVLDPAGMTVRLVRVGPPLRQPSHWYANGDDRRAVLDSWLQLLVPYFSIYEPPAGSYTT